MLFRLEMFLITSKGFWDQSNRGTVLFASGAAIALIAIADWLTKPYVSLGMLYAFPIVVAAGFLPRLALLALGVFCAGLSEAFNSLDPTWRLSRFLVEAPALVGGGLFVSEFIRNRRVIHETQQQLQRAQEQLRALIETSPAAIVSVNQDGAIELANRGAAELVNSPSKTVIGDPIATYVPELQDVLDTRGGTHFRTSMKCQVRRANGERVPAEVWFSTFQENGASKLAAIIAEITDERPEEIISGGECMDEQKRQALNARQIAVLRLIFQGLRNAEIEERLEMTSSAVKNVLHQLFLKMEARNRSQLVRTALERYKDLL